jgi:hypothetical protein
MVSFLFFSPLVSCLSLRLSFRLSPPPDSHRLSRPLPFARRRRRQVSPLDRQAPSIGTHPSTHPSIQTISRRFASRASLAPPGPPPADAYTALALSRRTTSPTRCPFPAASPVVHPVTPAPLRRAQRGLSPAYTWRAAAGRPSFDRAAPGARRGATRA